MQDRLKEERKSISRRSFSPPPHDAICSGFPAAQTKSKLTRENLQFCHRLPSICACQMSYHPFFITCISPLISASYFPVYLFISAFRLIVRCNDVFPIPFSRALPKVTRHLLEGKTDTPMTSI